VKSYQLRPATNGATGPCGTRLSNPFDMPNGSAQPNSSETSTPSILSSSFVVQHASDCTQEIQIQENQETNDIQDTQEINDIQQLQKIIPLKVIEEAIRRHSFNPAQHGRSNPLFEFARWVKSVESVYNLTCGPSLLRDLVLRWQAHNALHLPPNSDIYGEFLSKLPVVKYGQGEGLGTLLARGKKRPVPTRGIHLSPLVQDLARLCRELSETNGGVFHLGCAAAAYVLGVCPNTALAYLRQLQAVRIIQVVASAVAPAWKAQHSGDGTSKRVKIKGKAATYAYIAED